jgi:hypothetical protein
MAGGEADTFTAGGATTGEGEALLPFNVLISVLFSVILWGAFLRGLPVHFCAGKPLIFARLFVLFGASPAR